MINNIDYLDDQIIVNVARWSIFQISPVYFYFGGIVSQEVIKKNIYQLINIFDIGFFETIEDIKHNINRDIFGFRYVALISKYD